MSPYEQGFAAARHKVDALWCPYLPFSAAALQWMLGYSAGQL
jgi:hypothetical protein